MKTLSFETVLRMAQAALGDAFGLRDAGLLESGVYRAAHVALYADANVFLMAATLASGIVRNHPFVDGNKRIAWLAAMTMLEFNGYIVTEDDGDDSSTLMERLAAGLIDASYVAGWFERASSNK